MKNALLALASILTLILASCSTDTKPDEPSASPIAVESDNPYVKEYAGGYTIEVDGLSALDDVEAYTLADNGVANWLWIESDGNGGANLAEKKTGRWTATETQITIEIPGNSGPITEIYILKNGKFVNTLSNDRYLKPRI